MIHESTKVGSRSPESITFLYRLPQHELVAVRSIFGADWKEFNARTKSGVSGLREIRAVLSLQDEALWWTIAGALYDGIVRLTIQLPTERAETGILEVFLS